MRKGIHWNLPFIRLKPIHWKIQAIVQWPSENLQNQLITESLCTILWQPGHSLKKGGLSHTCGLGGGGCTGIPQGSTVEGGELAAPRLTSSKSNMWLDEEEESLLGPTCLQTYNVILLETGEAMADLARLKVAPNNLRDANLLWSTTISYAVTLTYVSGKTLAGLKCSRLNLR